jgi:hypothetical protein
MRSAPPSPWPNAETVIGETRGWLTQIVIALELCPFAKAVHVKAQIRYRVSEAQTPEALLEDLLGELVHLAAADPDAVDTTLLIHPRVLSDFLDYNDFLSVADVALEELELSGELQIASFHPNYQFDGNRPDDLANYVTRSPYPMLQVLREASVERALHVFPDASRIVDKNRRTLRALGHDGWQRLMAGVLGERR